MTVKKLFLDIENAPLTATSWGPTWKTNLIDVLGGGYILCMAYRWGEEGDTEIVAQPDFPKRYRKDREDDFKVVQAIHKLVNQADIVIAHNGDSFDTKMLNARFLLHGLGRPRPYHTVDTKLVSQRMFRLPSNRLDFLGGYLGLGHKLNHTGYDLWRQCMAGDPAAWELMKAYNIQDIDLLVAVYKRFLYEGWIKNHPNVTVYSDLDGCPSCGAPEEMLMRRGIRATDVNRYVQLHCKRCGSYCRSRFVDQKAPLTRRRTI